jgi:hypothetical protein
MDLSTRIDAGAESPFVSTGAMPPAELVQQLVDEARLDFLVSSPAG